MDDFIIYNTPDGDTEVALYAHDGKVWLTQKQMAKLFDATKQNISLHINNILDEYELDRDSVVKDYLTTATDGKQYPTKHYSLQMILAVGFRVRSSRGTDFRKWANRHLHEYVVKGFVMDDERLKNPNGRTDYFDELLARIRDIRASEKRFYQKLRDLFALSADYDKTDKQTQSFFAEVQNKLLYAVTGKGASEIVTDRADASRENMGLTNWKGEVVRKQDIFIAKNYLIRDEIDTLNRLVVIFLETAELRAKSRAVTTINFWRENAHQIITSNDFKLMEGKGGISKAQMEYFAFGEYERFDQRRKKIEALQEDARDDAELKRLEEKIKNRGT